MPVNLPPTLGSSSAQSGSLRPQARAHAQDFSTSQLHQRKERSAAITSMARALSRDSHQGPSSSIARALRGETAHADDEYSMYSDKDREEIRSRLRYQHIRKMMKEKKTAIETEKQATKQHGLHIKTGRTYSSSGYGGAKKSLRKEIRKGKHSKYKHLSSADKKHLEEIIEYGGKHETIGGTYSYSTKKSMSKKAWEKYKQGDISKQDYKTFKGIIRNLD